MMKIKCGVNHPVSPKKRKEKEKKGKKKWS